MQYFHSAKELISALYRERDLLSELFEKRKIPFKEEYALELVEYSEERLDFLKERGVLRTNAPFIEIDDQYLQFLETVLDVNEEINTSFINEHILQIKQSILYYLQENHESRKYAYVRSIKASLRKAGRITLRNIMDLNRNIEHAFKTEPTYAVKIAKLDHYDRKRQDITLLLDQIERLLGEDEQAFFKSALDEELRQIILHIRYQIIECRHNLIEIQKQIIEYLNQIKYQSRVAEHLRRIKHLKDQFELKTKTNIHEILSHNNAVVFEPNPSYPLKLSLDYLQTDEAWQAILRVGSKVTNRSGVPGLPLAVNIADDYLRNETDQETVIDLDAVRNSFFASGNHLFGFLLNYTYPREVSFEEKVTIFCRMVSLFEQELNVTDTYNRDGEIEYAVVYPG